MGAYLIRRLALMVPTLFGIIAINFAIVQLAPGGPVEMMLAQLKGHGDVMGALGASVPKRALAAAASTRASAGSIRTSSPTSGACSASTSRRSSASC